MRATIIGHFAEKNGVIRVENAREFQAALKTLNGNHTPHFPVRGNSVLKFSTLKPVLKPNPKKPQKYLCRRDAVGREWA
jgi:hypothetical protein